MFSLNSVLENIKQLLNRPSLSQMDELITQVELIITKTIKSEDSKGDFFE